MARCNPYLRSGDIDRYGAIFTSSTRKKAELLATSCRGVLILDDLESLLGDSNISRDMLDKIVDAYGDRTVEMAKNNAFQFVDVAGFAVSDKSHPPQRWRGTMPAAYGPV